MSNKKKKSPVPGIVIKEYSEGKEDTISFYVGIFAFIGLAAVLFGLGYGLGWAYYGIEAGYLAVNQDQLQVVYDLLTNVEHDIDKLQKAGKK